MNTVYKLKDFDVNVWTDTKEMDPGASQSDLVMKIQGSVT